MKVQRRKRGLIAGTLGLSLIFLGATNLGAGEKVVQNGKRVSIEYTLTLPDKTQVDTNVGKEPLTYTQGGEEILPALQKALAGLKEGETKQVTLSPEEGYGPVDPQAFQEVEKSHIPKEAWKAGTPLIAKDSAGRVHAIRVHEVKDKTVVLDLNHPLAGKTLIFDVKVLKVEDPPQ